MNRLHDKGYITDPVGKAKSVALLRGFVSFVLRLCIVSFVSFVLKLLMRAVLAA